MPSNINLEKEKSFLSFLLKNNKLSYDAYISCVSSLEENPAGEALYDLLVAQNVLSDEEFAKAKGRFLEIPYIDLTDKTIPKEIIKSISKESALNYRIIIFERDYVEGKVILRVAMEDPENPQARQALDFLEKKNNWKIEIFVSDKKSIDFQLKQLVDISREVSTALKEANIDLSGPVEEEEKDLLADEEYSEHSAPVSKAVSVIIRHAIDGKASDIHIEPTVKEVRVRFRIDGILYTSIVLPKKIQSAIVARIKILANLRIDEQRLPQDGRFMTKIDNIDIDFRVSTFPTVYGEKVVMRILEKSPKAKDFENLGIADTNLLLLSESIQASHGMVLVTGPTGSGKSTTLFTIMNKLDRKTHNVLTLEDPVEYYVDDVNHTQVKPGIGLTFAKGLRSILRQDPDIIMVGEIRDTETAEISVHAALTGHTVFSTLHTNSAIGAITRLIDMGIPFYLLSPSLRLIVAQRLVRKICSFCRESYIPEEKILDEIRDVVEHGKLKEKFGKDKKLVFYRGKGCVRCNKQGYKGRIGVYEVVNISQALREAINMKKSENEMIEIARKEGMVSMKEDGIAKALQGVTTIEEVFRVLESNY